MNGGGAPARVRAEVHRPVSPTPAACAAAPLLHHPRVTLVAASRELFGGHSVQAALLRERLCAEGYAVDWIPINPRFPEGLRWLRRIAYLRTLANELFYLPSLFRLRSADVVHVFSASYFSFLLGPAPAMLAARILRKRLVLNYHSGEAEDHLARWGLLVHPWLRLAHEIVVPSQFLHEIFARYGYTTRVIANIVDTSAFGYRARSDLRPRLLSTRNLETHYRVEIAIRAFALVKKRYPGATLLIAGYGTEEGRLRRLVEELELDGVTFYGRFPPSIAPRLYAGADVFVNASVIDNQPVSILEAFASGLPVVSTATGDIGAMLEGGSLGVIIPPEDPQAMARAVEALIESPAQSADMTRRAYRSLGRFGWKRVRDDWDGVYASRPA